MTLKEKIKKIILEEIQIYLKEIRGRNNGRGRSRRNYNNPRTPRRPYDPSRVSLGDQFKNVFDDIKEEHAEDPDFWTKNKDKARAKRRAENRRQAEYEKQQRIKLAKSLGITGWDGCWDTLSPMESEMLKLAMEGHEV